MKMSVFSENIANPKDSICTRDYEHVRVNPKLHAIPKCVFNNRINSLRLRNQHLSSTQQCAPTVASRTVRTSELRTNSLTIRESTVNFA